MDVAEWLRGLGLEQYEPAFRANEIDERVLPSLTAEDLKDLGVILVGPGCRTNTSTTTRTASAAAQRKGAGPNTFRARASGLATCGSVS